MPFVIMLGGTTLVLGCVYLTLGILWRRRMQQSRSWPTVQGKMVAAYVSQKTYLPDGSALGVAVPTTHYEPAVKYTYQVGEQSYIGHRYNLFFYPRNYGQAESQSVCAAWVPGKPVTVAYNPEHPAQAVIAHAAPPLKADPMILQGVWIAVGGTLVMALGIVLQALSR